MFKTSSTIGSGLDSGVIRLSDNGLGGRLPFTGIILNIFFRNSFTLRYVDPARLRGKVLLVNLSMRKFFGLLYAFSFDGPIFFRGRMPLADSSPR